MNRPFAAYKGDQPYAFVSYAHKDSDAVFREITRLKNQGINIWYDEGIEAGTEWTEALAGALKQSNLFLYFITPNLVASQNCRNELNFAIEHALPIIAIHLNETHLPDGLSLTLSTRQAILKYEIPTAEYQQKLQSRIASYLDQSITQPVVLKRKIALPIVAGFFSVIVLSTGLIFYSYQNFQKSSEVSTNPNDNVEVQTLRSIAVLPFLNMSTNEGTGFFAEGLSEDILDNLAKSKSLKVASRSASFQFTDRGVEPSSVGEKLKVAYLLEGSVRQQGDKVRITAQLIRTSDGFHVWSNSYERILSDGFEVQTALAVNTAHIARTKLKFDVL